MQLDYSNFNSSQFIDYYFKNKNIEQKSLDIFLLLYYDRNYLSNPREITIF